MDKLMNLPTKEATLSSLEVAEMVEKQMQSIYVVENEGGNIKIGVSSNVKKRIKTLSNQGGFFVKNVFYTNPCSNAFAIEKEAHMTLSEERIAGEWFSTDFLRAKQIVENLYDKISCKEPRKEKILTPEEIENAFGRNQKDFPLTEFTKTVGKAMDEIGAPDLQKLLVYRRIFEKAGIPTGCLDIAEREILERENSRH